MSNINDYIINSYRNTRPPIELASTFSSYFPSARCVDIDVNALQRMVRMSIGDALYERLGNEEKNDRESLCLILRQNNITHFNQLFRTRGGSAWDILSNIFPS